MWCGVVWYGAVWYGIVSRMAGLKGGSPSAARADFKAISRCSESQLVRASHDTTPSLTAPHRPGTSPFVSNTISAKSPQRQTLCMYQDKDN